MIVHEKITNDATGDITVVAFFPDKEEALVTTTSHNKHFNSILRGLAVGDASVYDLFDPHDAINHKFKTLTNRYSVKNGTFYRDLDPLENALADQVVRFVDEGVDDWKPLVAFLERVDANPSHDSRKDLCDWIAVGKLTITDDGMIVGYKCVNVVDDGYASTVAGPAVVDGREHDPSKLVPNVPGSLVEMPRSKVDDNNAKQCSVGLHVGTYAYAEWYSKQRGDRAILEVIYDPADAVAVPKDHNAQKIRVCRYRVRNAVDAPYNSIIRPIEDYTTQEEYEYYDDPDAPDTF